MTCRKTLDSLSLGCLLFLIIGCGLALFLIRQDSIKRYEEFLANLQYTPEVVVQVCETFQLSAQDVFCIDPSKQTAKSFEEMLQRNFPPNQAVYADIIPRINPWIESAWHCKEIVSYRASCPPPNECNPKQSYYGKYDCHFDLSFMTSGQGLMIWIDGKSGKIVELAGYYSGFD